jgi:hypothetical protein
MPRSVSLVGLARTGVIPQNNSTSDCSFYDPVVLGLDNALICPEPEHAGAEGEVHRRERLGGLLNYYYRKAA